MSEDRIDIWRPGERVTVRGCLWTVNRTSRFADCEALHLADAAGNARTLLVPFDRPRRARPRVPQVVRLRRWIHQLREVLRESHPHGGLRFCPPGIRLLPYQLEPALAMVGDGHARVLIADGVGLGKTIQAGLILSELAGADGAFRALILTPAGLRQQWHDELSRHFRLDAALAGAPWLRAAARELPADVNPWSLPGSYLASFDFAKRPEALRALEDVRWDLLVVDEAHAATIGTDRRAAIDAIARRSRRVVLLTATPHPGDPDQFRALCDLGAHPHSPPPIVFRRTRASTGSAVPRRSAVLLVRPSLEERDMHRLLEAYTGQIWDRASGSGDPAARLGAILLRKRALSSAASLAVSARRRLELLSGTDTGPAQLPLPLDPLEEEDSLEDAVPDAALGTPGLRDPAVESQWLDRVANAAASATRAERKVHALARLLRRLAQPAIVFTEYRDTLAHLRASLAAAGFRVPAIHGGMSPSERTAALTVFEARGGTLLATDAAAEGLNLQRTCRVVVHFELPWNPSRMEQRAGRVDRLGQSRRVHEIALVADDTAEALVLAPLLRRVARGRGTFETGMLDALTETRIAEIVIAGESPPDPGPSPSFIPTSTEYQDSARAEAARLAGHRLLADRSGAPHRLESLVPLAAVTAADLVPGLVQVFVIAVRDGRGRNVHSEVTLVHAAMPRLQRQRRARDVRIVAPRLLQAAVDASTPTLVRLVEERINAIQPAVTRAISARRQREDDVSACHTSAARQLVQAGLFDRRAARAAAERQRAASASAEEAEGQNAALAAAPELTGSAELRAVLLMGRR